MIDYKAVLAHHAKPVPRYTSYPTAPVFAAGEGVSIARDMISGLVNGRSVSVYIHIPFCDRLCWFCGCHTKHTLKYEPVKRYVDHLVKEIEQLRARSTVVPHIAHLHLGGGSPSLLSRDDMARIRDALAATFLIDRDSEISVEIDPSDASNDFYEGLLALGVTRASIGVQDFSDDVQNAINRPQTFEQTMEVVERLRMIGVKSVNIDALYGLPRQSLDRLLRTLELSVSLAPDRMALFGYAHVPWMKKHQKMIKEADLIGSLERFEHAEQATAFLVEHGYRAIGIDHFAKPGDALAVAAEEGSLKRNFQGYTTDDCTTLIGFGGSSIGRSEDGYFQNIVSTGLYQAAVEAGKVPVDRGYRFQANDKIEAHIIERLMCDFEIDFSDIEKRFPGRAQPYLEKANILAAQDQFGLCGMDGNSLVIQPEARSFTRIVASAFDAYFEPEKFRYSKAV